MRISYDDDGDALFRPKGLAACERVLPDVQVKREGAVFSVDTPVADVGAAGARSGQAPGRIHGLGAPRTRDTRR